MPPYKLLEKKYASFVGADYAISCNSGTSALHLALMAIGVGPGDSVIVPDFTMAACGFAISYTGATPIFVDCDDTLNMDVSLIEKKITKKTKAIMAVHIYGRLCNMKEILRIAKKHKLKVIEDACEAQGAVYESKADITCYSFYENKIIHAEEGGMCTTNNKQYADKINYLKNMAFGEKHDYFHEAIGFNYRMPNAQALLAIKSLELYPRENKRRRDIEKLAYGLNYLDAVWVLPSNSYVFTKEFSGKWTLESQPTRQFFKPLSSFPMYGGKCQSPRAKYYSENGFYIKI